LVTPAPLMVRIVLFGVEMVKALAPGLNTMLFTEALAESVTEVMAEVAKVAVTVGTVIGFQLLPVFQSLKPGF
jgi:hypothetical protein